MKTVKKQFLITFAILTVIFTAVTSYAQSVVSGQLGAAASATTTGSVASGTISGGSGNGGSISGSVTTGGGGSSSGGGGGFVIPNPNGGSLEVSSINTGTLNAGGQVLGATTYQDPNLPGVPNTSAGDTKTAFFIILFATLFATELSFLTYKKLNKKWGEYFYA